MNLRPKIQLKSSNYTMANLMASSKLNLQPQIQRSRFHHTLTLPRQPFNLRNPSSYATDSQSSTSTHSILTESKFQHKYSRSKQNSIPLTFSEKVERIDSARKNFKEKNVLQRELQELQDQRDDRDRDREKIRNRDRKSTRTIGSHQKYIEMQSQFITSKNSQLMLHIQECNIKIDKLQEKTDTLQKYIENQEILNKVMGKENKELEEQIDRMKVVCGRLEMLERMGAENEKMMRESEEVWWRGKEGLMEGLREELKVEMDRLKKEGERSSRKG